jgi:hypothetical protein
MRSSEHKRLLVLVAAFFITAWGFFSLGQSATNSATEPANVKKIVALLSDSVYPLRITPTEIPGKVTTKPVRQHSLECGGCTVHVPWSLTTQKNENGICGGLFEETILAVNLDPSPFRAELWNHAEICPQEIRESFVDDLTFHKFILNYTPAEFRESEQGEPSLVCSVILLSLKAHMFREGASAVRIVKVLNGPREAIQLCDPNFDRKCRILVYEDRKLRTQFLLKGKYDQEAINFIISNLIYAGE